MCLIRSTPHILTSSHFAVEGKMKEAMHFRLEERKSDRKTTQQKLAVLVPRWTPSISRNKGVPSLFVLPRLAGDKGGMVCTDLDGN